MFYVTAVILQVGEEEVSAEQGLGGKYYHLYYHLFIYDWHFHSKYLKNTWQFDSGGEIQIRKNVSFWIFSNSFVTCHKEITYFFSIVCRTELLRQTEILFVSLNQRNIQKTIFVTLGHCKKQNLYMLWKRCISMV